MMKTRRILACLLVIALLGIAVGCGGKTLKWSKPPAMTIDPDKLYTATIKTNYGDIVI